MNDLDNRRKRFLLLNVEDLVVDYVEACIFDKDWTEEEGAWVYHTVGRRGLRGLLNKWIGPTQPKHEENQFMQLERVILYKGGIDDDHPQGSTIPKEVLVEAVKEHNKAISLAVFLDGKLVVIRETTEIDAESTFDNFSGFTDAQVITCFHSEGETIQPWIILGDEENPELIAFLHGEDAVIADVIAKIKKYHASADSSAEFWSMVSNPDNTALGDMLRDESALLLFSNNGSVHEVLKGNVSTETDWGTHYGSSSDNGGTEVKAADEFKGPSSSVTFGKKDKVEPKQVVTETTKEKIIKPSKVPMAQLKPEDISAFSTKYKGRCNVSGKVTWFDPDYEPFLRCPDNVSGLRPSTREEIQRYYEEHFGWIPLNWGDRPIVPVSLAIKRKNVDLKNIKDTTSQVALQTKDAGTKNIPPGLNLPPAMINDFKTNLLPKILGNNTEEIANPESLKKQQTGVKSIAELVGRPSIYDFRMGWLGLLHIAKESPEIIAHIAHDWQYFGILKMERIADLEEALKKEQEAVERLNSALAAGTREEPKKFSTFGKK